MMIDSEVRHVGFKTAAREDSICNSSVEIPNTSDQSEDSESLEEKKIDESPAKDDVWENLSEFVCMMCNLALSNKHSLAMHMADHEDDTIGLFSCQVCNDVFYRIVPWMNHFQMHQEQLKLLLAQKKPNALEEYYNAIVLRKFKERMMYFRKKCDSGMKSVRNSIKNQITLKFEESNNGDDGDFMKTDSCIGVPSTSNNRSNQTEIVEHLPHTSTTIIKQELSPKTQCKSCQKQFVYASNLIKHILPRVNKCPNCTQTFKTKKNLTIHAAESQCEIKQEQLNNYEDMESSVNTYVKKENCVYSHEHAPQATCTLKIRCKICQRGFSSSEAMKNHEKSHYRIIQTYERSAMTNKSGSQEHGIKTEHPIEYKCNDCDKQFPFNLKLALHIISEHVKFNKLN